MYFLPVPRTQSVTVLYRRNSMRGLPVQAPRTCLTSEHSSSDREALNLPTRWVLFVSQLRGSSDGRETAADCLILWTSAPGPGCVPSDRPRVCARGALRGRPDTARRQRQKATGPGFPSHPTADLGSAFSTLLLRGHLPSLPPRRLSQRGDRFGHTPGGSSR